MNDRCLCGARIVLLSHLDMSDGIETFIYTCGVCGSEIEVKKETDPRSY